MVDEIANADIEKKAKSVKSLEEIVEAFNFMEKVIENNKFNILWLAYQQGQIFEKLKMNKYFINMVKEVVISKSTILFKILIVKFINK